MKIEVGVVRDTGLIGASCLGVLLLTMRMTGGDFEEVDPRVWLRLAAYLPWLMWEITKANLDVTLCVLGIRPISPRLVRVRASQKTTLGQVIYANSITLTPGTVSVELEEDAIIVHAISREAAEGTLEGAIDRRVSAVEGQ